jgi:hypothetical protein
MLSPSSGKMKNIYINNLYSHIVGFINLFFLMLEAEPVFETEQ